MIPLQAAPPSRLAESLSGLNERVTFHKEESGRVVLKVKAKDHHGLVCVVSSVALVNSGE